MPLAFVPRKSTAHRLTCRALYKELLKACNKLHAKSASSTNLTNSLRSLVRFRFNHDRRLQNLTQIKDALQHGRQSLNVLRLASVGDTAACSKLKDRLSSSISLVGARRDYIEHCRKDGFNYPPHVLAKKERYRKLADPLTYTRKPGSVPVFERPVPLSAIKSGKRFVPQYVLSQGLAFLRYHKPQPHSLSAWIRRQRKADTDRWLYKSELENMIRNGNLEDDWESVLNSAGYLQDVRPEKEPGWSSVYRQEYVRNTTAMQQADVKRYKDAEKLMKVLLKERELAKQEMVEVKPSKKGAQTAIAFTPFTASNREGAKDPDAVAA